MTDEERRSYEILGSRYPNAKLVRTQVQEIRERYAAGGITQEALAAEFGVTTLTIGNIVRRKTWKDV